ncbi:MAG: hypothetical protein IJP17_06795 [Clostridia bacterium]|nr:hypothetical protein [Clostridia bacterium]
MKIRKSLLIFMLALALLTFPITAYATEGGTTTTSKATTTTTTTATTTKKTTTTTTTTTTSKTTKTTTTTTLVISQSPENSLGSITFKTSNSKRIEVGKSTALYLTIKDMPSSINTVFNCSDASIVSIEKISNTCVKVVGLKEGEVVISASAEGKTAKYNLIVGGADMTAAGGADTNATTTNAADYVDINLFDGYETELSQFIKEENQNSATSVIFGIIFWAAIVTVFGVILSVIFRGRNPSSKINLNPGSRRRFNTGGYRGNYRKRLLPDHYYRSIRKY